jgi:hypothetical protein
VLRKPPPETGNSRGNATGASMLPIEACGARGESGFAAHCKKSRYPNALDAINQHGNDAQSRIALSQELPIFEFMSYILLHSQEQGSEEIS